MRNWFTFLRGLPSTLWLRTGRAISRPFLAAHTALLDHAIADAEKHRDEAFQKDPESQSMAYWSGQLSGLRLARSFLD